MVAIVTRAGKGSPLTNAEVDANFVNLNNGKLETSNNLSDLADAAAARTNLGLGSLATQNSITSLQVTTALGYTPANRAGDTFTGDVAVLGGRILLGSTVLSNGKFIIGGSLTGQALMSAMRAEVTVMSDVTTGARGYQTLIGTEAASFTLPDIIHYRAVQAAIGAGSTVNSQNAFVADASLIGAGTNIGFRGAIPAGTNRWNLYMDGTAQNYLGGATILNAALGLGPSGSPSFGTSGQLLKSGGSGAAPSWAALTSGEVTTALGFTPLAPSAIGSSIQAYSANLAAIAGLTPTLDNFVVGNGTTWILETPAQSRASLGGTTVGQNIFTLTNPSAISFLRLNADNTVSALDAATFRTAIGAGTSSTTGTVTSITAGTGLSGGTITGSGTIALANTAVTAGSYTTANITVDAQGRITAASNGAGGGAPGVVQNTFTSYGNTATTGTRSGYYGILLGSATSHLNVMADTSGNGGFYRESNGVWPVYYNASNNCIGVCTSTTASGYSIYTASSIYASGNVVAASDERLKTNWRDLGEDFVELLAGVKHGIYDRLDVSATQVGVSAQSLQGVLTHAVSSNDEGILAVNYGNAAMVSAIQLAQQVVSLKERLRILEQKVGA